MKPIISKGISIVLPCLNEAKSLPRVLKAALAILAKSDLPGEVLVADNGSTDGSQEIAKKFGARVVPIQLRGYGAAVDGGIRSARYEYVIFCDSECTYPMARILALIATLRAGRAEFVLGSRLKGNIKKGAMPFLNRYLGTPLLSLLIRLFYRIPVSDCNSGMRALKKSVYEKLGLKCPGMEYASEMLIRVGQLRLKYAEVPIDYCKGLGARKPHLRRWPDGLRHLQLIFLKRFTNDSAPSRRKAA